MDIRAVTLILDGKDYPMTALYSVESRRYVQRCHKYLSTDYLAKLNNYIHGEVRNSLVKDITIVEVTTRCNGARSWVGKPLPHTESTAPKPIVRLTGRRIRQIRLRGNCAGISGKR